MTVLVVSKTNSLLTIQIDKFNLQIRTSVSSIHEVIDAEGTDLTYSHGFHEEHNTINMSFQNFSTGEL